MFTTDELFDLTILIFLFIYNQTYICWYFHGCISTPRFFIEFVILPVFNMSFRGRIRTAHARRYRGQPSRTVRDTRKILHSYLYTLGHGSNAWYSRELESHLPVYPIELMMTSSNSIYFYNEGCRRCLKSTLNP